MRKKILMVILSASMIVALLSGCGSLGRDKLVPVMAKEVGEAESKKDKKSASEEEEAKEEETEEAASKDDEADSGEVDSKKKELVTVLAKEIEYFSSGDILRWYEYEYDSVGNLIKKTEYDGYDSSIYGWHEYEYDSVGNLTKMIYYDSDGDAGSYEKYEYDHAGRMTDKKEYHANDSSPRTWYGYEYDSAGNQTKEIIYSNDGSVYYYDEYEYDSAGRPTLMKSYNTVFSSGVFQLAYGGWGEYEYNNVGDKMEVKVTTYIIPDHAPSHVTEERVYEYDDAGNLTKYIHYADPDSNYKHMDEGYEYEYDGMGNLIKKKRYSQPYYGDREITLQGWTEYEYITIEVETPKGWIDDIDDETLREAVNAYISSGVYDYSWGDSLLFAYIDEDDIPELLVLPRTVGDDPIHIYSYYNGSVIPSGGGWAIDRYQSWYIERENLIFNCWGEDGIPYDYYIYSIENGEFVTQYSQTEERSWDEMERSWSEEVMYSEYGDIFDFNRATRFSSVDFYSTLKEAWDACMSSSH